MTDDDEPTMSILKRLVLGITACFGSGCGSRAFEEHRLLDPCITDGARLTVYASVERGTRETHSGVFNPNGPSTWDRVAQADLYELEFELRDDAAAISRTRHLLGIQGRPLAPAITETDGRLDLAPLPPEGEREARELAPTGSRCCVRRGDRFFVYSDAARGTELDAGTVPAPGSVRFTWDGERLYIISWDAEGRVSRIFSTAVGSGGEWDEFRYDAELTPLDGDRGATYVEAYDLLDGEPVLLLRKCYTSSNGSPAPRVNTLAIVRGTRVVSTWTGDELGWIQPDIRAVVGWQRSFGALQATLTLRSLDDGSLRTWEIDARPVLDRPAR